MTRFLCRSLLLAVCALAVATGPALADKIYRTTDDQGNVVYTNKPPSDDARPVQLDPLTTVPSPAEDTTGRQAEKVEQKALKKAPVNGLTGLHIVYPPAGKGVRHNGGNLPVRVALEPKGAALPRGHHLEILLDGKVRGRTTGTRVVISPVDRGPHRLQAQVTDKAGKVRYQSDTIKFYLLRVAVGNSN